MYNARERITRGMLKTAAVLPTGNIQICDMKAPKEVPFYVSTAERAAAKQQRENRKKLSQERRAKARSDKQIERAFNQNNFEVTDYVAETVEAEYEFDKDVVFTEEEKQKLAAEMCAIIA